MAGFYPYLDGRSQDRDIMQWGTREMKRVARKYDGRYSSGWDVSDGQDPSSTAARYDVYLPRDRVMAVYAAVRQMRRTRALWP
jgi:hypothetical protein